MQRHEKEYQAFLISSRCNDEDIKNAELKKVFFEKSYNSMYKNMDIDTIEYLNNQYDIDSERYNYLVNRLFDGVLSASEHDELYYLENKIGAFTPTHYITKIIEYSKIVISELYTVLKKVKIKKPFKCDITTFCKFIDKCIKYDYKRYSTVSYTTLNTINKCMKLCNTGIFCDISPPIHIFFSQPKTYSSTPPKIFRACELK